MAGATATAQEVIIAGVDVDKISPTAFTPSGFIELISLASLTSAMPPNAEETTERQLTAFLTGPEI